MSKNSRDTGAKKVQLLESNKDKGSDPKKAWFNMTTNVGTSTGAFLTWKSFVTEMKSLKNSHVQVQNSDSDANEYWVNFIDS